MNNIDKIGIVEDIMTELKKLKKELWLEENNDKLIPNELVQGNILYNVNGDKNQCMYVNEWGCLEVNYGNDIIKDRQKLVTVNDIKDLKVGDIIRVSYDKDFSDQDDFTTLGLCVITGINEKDITIHFFNSIGNIDYQIYNVAMVKVEKAISVEE